MFTGVTINYNTSQEHNVADLKSFLPAGKIPLSIQFMENGKKLKLRTAKKISLTEHNLEALEQTCIIKITL